MHADEPRSGLSRQDRAKSWTEPLGFRAARLTRRAVQMSDADVAADFDLDVEVERARGRARALAPGCVFPGYETPVAALTEDLTEHDTQVLVRALPADDSAALKKQRKASGTKGGRDALVAASHFLQAFAAGTSVEPEASLEFGDKERSKERLLVRALAAVP